MATDNFTDTNGTALETHDSAWASLGKTGVSNRYTVGLLEIQSNECRGENGFERGGARYTDSTDVNFCEIIVRIPDADAGYWGVCIQGTATRRGYFVVMAGLSGDNFTTVDIYEDNGSSENFLAGSSGSWDRTGDIKIKVELAGTTLTVDVNDTEEISITESGALTGGDPAFYKDADLESVGVFDDWTDGVIGGGAFPYHVIKQIRRGMETLLTM